MNASKGKTLRVCLPASGLTKGPCSGGGGMGRKRPFAGGARDRGVPRRPVYLAVMRIADFLRKDCVAKFRAPDKEAALHALCLALSRQRDVPPLEQLAQAIRARETLMSTGLGLGLAVPHVELECLHELVLGIGVLEEAISFESLDDRPVKVIAMVLVPTHSHHLYLKLLSRLVTAVKNDGFREAVSRAADAEEVYRLFAQL